MLALQLKKHSLPVTQPAKPSLRVSWKRENWFFLSLHYDPRLKKEASRKQRWAAGTKNTVGNGTRYFTKMYRRYRYSRLLKKVPAYFSRYSLLDSTRTKRCKRHFGENEIFTYFNVHFKLYNVPKFQSSDSLPNGS